MKEIYTKNAPDAIGPYSQAIIAGKLIYTSGQIPINPATGTIDTATIKEQTARACSNIKAILESVGSSTDKVIKTSCFLKNMEDFAGFNEVYAEYFTKKPARSCVAVKELPKGALVEIEVIAEA